MCVRVCAHLFCSARVYRASRTNILGFLFLCLLHSPFRHSLLLHLPSFLSVPVSHCSCAKVLWQLCQTNVKNISFFLLLFVSHFFSSIFVFASLPPSHSSFRLFFLFLPPLLFRPTLYVSSSFPFFDIHVRHNQLQNTKPRFSLFSSAQTNSSHRLKHRLLLTMGILSMHTHTQIFHIHKLFSEYVILHLSVYQRIAWCCVLNGKLSFFEIIISSRHSTRLADKWEEEVWRNRHLNKNKIIIRKKQ